MATTTHGGRIMKVTHSSTQGSTTVSQSVLDRLWVEAVRQQVRQETVR